MLPVFVASCQEFSYNDKKTIELSFPLEPGDKVYTIDKDIAEDLIIAL